MRSDFFSEKLAVAIICDNVDEYKKLHQLIALFSSEGLSMVTSRELPEPKLETRPGGVLVLTFTAQTFASIRIAELVEGQLPEKLEDSAISLPLVNAQAVNAWWEKNRETVVRKWLTEKHLIPHNDAGGIGGIFSRVFGGKRGE